MRNNAIQDRNENTNSEHQPADQGCRTRDGYTSGFVNVTYILPRCMEGRYVGQLLGRLQDNFRTYKKCINMVVLKVPLFYYSKCELFDEQS